MNVILIPVYKYLLIYETAKTYALKMHLKKFFKYTSYVNIFLFVSINYFPLCRNYDILPRDGILWHGRVIIHMLIVIMHKLFDVFV